MSDYKNHYWVNFSSDEYQDATLIHSTDKIYNDANEWAEDEQKNTGDTGIQVWEFQQVPGIVADVIDFFRGEK